MAFQVSPAITEKVGALLLQIPLFFAKARAFAFGSAT
jgi:hypothetical protein